MLSDQRARWRALRPRRDGGDVVGPALHGVRTGNFGVEDSL
jgi:hypothetical protein